MGNIKRSDGNKCPVCGCNNIDIWSGAKEQNDEHCYSCLICGTYFAPNDWYYKYLSKGYNTQGYDMQKLKAYLFHNKGEMHPYIVPAEKYKKLDKSEFLHIYNLTPEMVENWHPKTIDDRIDKILIYFNKKIQRIGGSISKNYLDLTDVFMLDIFDIDVYNFVPNSVLEQVDFHNEVLKKYCTITLSRISANVKWSDTIKYQIKPEGYSRIESLTKDEYKDNKNVFVAMKFGEETNALRAAIKAGIEKAGYIAVILDEVEYNGQIVPEMLYQIRQSRFVVAELSHHNNGAYYEAGYAAGYGKDVIQICSEEALKSDLHFDVKQVNSITYSENNLEELTDKLQKRIKSTIQ